MSAVLLGERREEGGMGLIIPLRPSFIRHDSSRRILDSSTLEEPRIYDATMEIDINMMNGDEDFFEV